MRDYAIILAADLPTPQEVVSVVKAVGKIVDGIKIAEATLLQCGVSIINQCRDVVEGRPILIDLKIADIGFRGSTGWEGTNGKIIRSLAGSGATHITVHGFPGPVSVAEAVSVAREAGIGVLLLPLMSHAAASLFFSRPVNRSDLVYASLKAALDVTFPEDLTCTDVTEGILLLGEALDVDGYIGPATRPSDLERYRALTGKPLWCPGFGRQDRLGRDLEEQFRNWAHIVGPSSAAIVGSLIFGAADSAAAAKEVCEIRDRVVG
jgi:orotidine-5'-phosphate decarboxylase